MLRRRTLLRAPALFGPLLLTAACSSLDDDSDRQQLVVNQAETERLEEELAEELAAVRLPQLPGYVPDISVSYQDAWPDKGLVGVGLELLASEKDRLDIWADKATELLWLSRISPLRRISLRIGWGEPKAPQLEGVRDFTPLSGDAGRAELEAKYGPRPVAEESGT